MAAKDRNQLAEPLTRGGNGAPSAAEVIVRLDEEIGRAERHGTQLSCLLVQIEDLDELAREHGAQLSEQTLAYVAEALREQLRRFDRVGRPDGGELLVVLPGADGPRGEVVARRIMGRLRTIKVEAHGERNPLRVSLALAAWRADMSPQDLMGQMRRATRPRNGEEGLGQGRSGLDPPAEETLGRGPRSRAAVGPTTSS